VSTIKDTKEGNTIFQSVMYRKEEIEFPASAKE
jgi:hypothetical protein